MLYNETDNAGFYQMRGWHREKGGGMGDSNGSPPILNRKMDHTTMRCLRERAAS